MHVRAAARIDVCAAERRSIRQRCRPRPRPRRIRPRHDDDGDDDDDEDNFVVVGDASLSFGCTGARLSIWEPTLPFLLLSSTAPHPSATAAAAAAPAASLRPNPRSADTSTPYPLPLYLPAPTTLLLASFAPSFHLSVLPSLSLSLLVHRSPISSLSFRAPLLFSPSPPLFLDSFFLLLSVPRAHDFKG